MTNYLFKSQRLGFRQWTEADKILMGEINSKPSVMEFFPSIPTQDQTNDFVNRMMVQQNEKSYCYFAVDRLDIKEFIGFVGLSYQTYDADFTPCVDIGWRLHPDHWGKGFATEGAIASLEYGFNTIGLEEIVSICPVVNWKSENVMKKIGMKKLYEFNHPLLSQYPELEKCVLYSIKKDKET